MAGKITAPLSLVRGSVARTLLSVTLGPYDLFVLVALVLGFLHGRSKGLSWQVSGIATLGLGYLGATAGAAVLPPLFPDAWPDDVKKLSAWIATYALVSVAIYVLTLKLSKKLKENELEELDRRFGGALGALKAALLVAVVSLVAITTSERARTLVKQSVSGPVLARVAFAAQPLLPKKIGDAVADVAGQIAPEPMPDPRPAPVKPAPTTTVAPGPVAPKPVPKPVTPKPTQPARPLPGTNELESPPPPLPPPPPAPETGDEGDDMDTPKEPKEPQDPLAPPPPHPR
jgi:uncharacterized membrane protein required for colicin V production